MNTNDDLLSPVSSSERIKSLDVLRGCAVLGILIMNIQSYAMIEAAYLNPAAYGDLTGANKWVWIFSHMFADQKFMTIFSILFGAGIVLFSSRAVAKGRKTAGLHYRRTGWLLLIGLIHAYILWHGDILVCYAMCALIVFLFRNASPKKLLIGGLCVISVSSFLYLMMGSSMHYWDPESVRHLMESWKPGTDLVAEEIAVYQGSWAEQMSHRVPSSLMFQTFIFLIWSGWRAGGLMLVGMALYKWGVLTAQRSARFYRIMALAGLGIGWPIVILGVIFNFSKGWALKESMFFGMQFNYWGSLLVGIAYISIVMLISNSHRFQKITDIFAAVGRMAFTNYLLQTILCTFLFYGHGLGLFGQVERTGQILIVIGVWILQLIISPLWLRHFRFGPVEWLWRSLTYWKIQSLRI